MWMTGEGESWWSSMEQAMWVRMHTASSRVPEEELLTDGTHVCLQNHNASSTLVGKVIHPPANLSAPPPLLANGDSYGLAVSHLSQQAATISTSGTISIFDLRTLQQPTLSVTIPTSPASQPSIGTTLPHIEVINMHSSGSTDEQFSLSLV